MKLNFLGGDGDGNGDGDGDGDAMLVALSTLPSSSRHEKASVGDDGDGDLVERAPAGDDDGDACLCLWKHYPQSNADSSWQLCTRLDCDVDIAMAQESMQLMGHRDGDVVYVLAMDVKSPILIEFCIFRIGSDAGMMCHDVELCCGDGHGVEMFCRVCFAIHLTL